MRSKNQSHEPAFDHIRAFAALLILAYHSIQHMTGFMSHGSWFTDSDRLSTHNPFFSLLLEGHTAVGLFIVLSGFLFTRSALGQAIDYRSFLKNRLLRIYPLYLLLIAVAVGINPGLSLQTLVMVIFPTDSIAAIQGIGVIGSMFWAVAVEFQFYLIFPFLMRALNERGIRPLLAIIAFAIIVRFFATYQGANPRDISYWTSIGRIDQFLIGMIAAKLCADRPSVAARMGKLLLPSIAVIIAVIYEFHRLGGWPVIASWKIVWPTVEGLMWAFFLCAYVPVARSIPRFLSQIASRVGQISYSTYLLHVSIIGVIGANGWFVRWTANPKYDLALTILLVVLPITLGVSALSYYAIEKPFLGLRIRYTMKLDKAPKAAS